MKQSILGTKLAPAAIALGALTGVVAVPLVTATPAVARPAHDAHYGDIRVYPSQDSYTEAETAGGITVRVETFRVGDVVTLRTTSPVTGELTSEGSATAAHGDGGRGAVATVTLIPSTGTLLPGTHAIALDFNGHTIRPNREPVSFEVTPDLPTFSLSTNTIAADEFASEVAGVDVTGKHFQPGEYRVRVESDVEDVEPLEFPTTVEADGALAAKIHAGTTDDVNGLAGEYTVTILDPDGVQIGDAEAFTVTASETPPEDETDDGTTPPEDETDDGTTPPEDETHDGTTPPEDETHDGTTPPEDETTPADDESTPADDGTDDEWTWDEWIWLGGELQEGLNLEAEQVSPEKFVDTGVAFAVLGCEPDQDVAFAVHAGAHDVKPYEATVTADENGIAVHGVVGLDATDPSVYIGEYIVTATCGDDSWSASFQVGDDEDVADPGEGTGREDENPVDRGDRDARGDSGSAAANNGGHDGSLPRTGTELTGVAAGAGLLILGAATVLLTRRRATQTGPADI